MGDQSTTSLLDRTFAVGTAFLLPGLVLLFGVSTVNATVEQWFTGAQTGPTIAGLVFVLAAALGLTMVLTAVRWLIFERLPLRSLSRREALIPRPTPLPLAKRAECEAQYQDLRHSHYFHYLASANMSVAVPLAILMWKIGSQPAPSWSVFLTICSIGLVATVALGWSAVDALHRYLRRRDELLGCGPDTESATPATA